ncbi:MAG: hypothetical protein DBX59_03985 [Bacillota bacterium]|nr:MAG: hypothetical protein DBX59_03985 [Bacillota bacterium]
MMTYRQWCGKTHRTVEQKRSYKRKILKQNLLGTGMVILPFLGFLCFTLFPMLMSLLLSFSNLRSALISEATFDAGFQNYIFILKDEYTWKALRTTLVYSLTTFINLTLAVFLANVMHKQICGKKFWLIIFFLPQVCSSVSTTLMWRWILSENGVFNNILGALGAEPIYFFTDASWYMIAIFMMSAWQHGTNIVVLLSAFAGINASLQEASRLDGANEWQVFWKITLPQLTPTIYYLLTINLIASLQEQAIFQFLNTTGVGPDFWGLTLTYQMYRLINVNYQYGLSCALSWCIGIFIMIITAINSKLSEKWVSYD